MFVKFFCNILFVKKINFEMFFWKEFFSINFFPQKIFLLWLGSFLFVKTYFGTFWFWIIFFQKK